MREARAAGPLLRRRGAGNAAALAGVVALALGCGGPTRPSVVLVVVDTLRADHLHHAGLPHAISPRLDAMAGEGVRFSNAFATAPWTVPSLASLFVSQLPSEHRVTVFGAALPEGHETLAELLARAGYRTAAFTANLLLGPRSGFAQGFETYRVVAEPAALAAAPGEALPNAPAERLSAHALAWLDRLADEAPDAPFFLYLHYMEPHTPYRCRPGAAERCREHAADLHERLMAERWDFSPEEGERIRSLYRAEVRRIDRALGRLAGELERRGLRERTWLFVTADHGEQLGERGAWLHGLSLDRREIQVPLLALGPSRRRDHVDTPVSLVDLAPTVLELAGIAVPASFRGRSLLPALRGEPLEAAPAVAEAIDADPVGPGAPDAPNDPPLHRLAVVTRDETLLLDYAGAVSRLAHANDAEAPAAAATRADLSRALGARAAWIDLSHAPQPVELDPETRDRLRALGYERR